MFTHQDNVLIIIKISNLELFDKWSQIQVFTAAHDDNVLIIVKISNFELGHYKLSRIQVLMAAHNQHPPVVIAEKNSGSCLFQIGFQ